MKKRNSTRRSLSISILSVVLCIALLAGSTFAWFTDSVSSGRNKIVAGNLDIELKHYTDDSSAAETVKDSTNLFKINLWEPGAVVYENFVVSNEGTLALKYDLTMNVIGFNTILDGYDVHDLTEVLKVAILDEAFVGTREDAKALTFDSTLYDFYKNGSLMPHGQDGSSQTFAIVVYWEPSDNDNIYNANNLKATSDGEPLFVELGINLVAAQKDYEEDSFGDDYDADTETHTHAYSVQPSGLWKCKYCNSIIENTDNPYIMIYDADNLKAIPILQSNADELAAIGLTIIATAEQTTFYYTNTGATATERTVYIRMSGNDLVVDAPLDTIYRYGKANDVYVINVADHSLNEEGTVNDYSIIGSGHINVGATASIKDLAVEKGADAENVSITIAGSSENVATLAVYDEQKDKVTIVKKDTDGGETETTPKEMKDAGDSVAIINNEAARVGTTLYDSLDEAAKAANEQGNVLTARAVNDQVLTDALAVPSGTILKVEPFVQVNISEECPIALQSSSSLVNVGTIVNTNDDGAATDSGISVSANAGIVNYGGFFDDTRSVGSTLPDGGIFNQDGQKIENDGVISNIGTIDNSGEIVNNESADISNSGSIKNSTEDATIENNGKLENNENASIENKGEIVNNENAELSNKGDITNEADSTLTNKGSVTNYDTGDITNNGTIVNDGENAELNIQSGSTTGDGDIENKNGATTVEEDSGKAARVNSTYYDTVEEAMSNLTDGKTIKILKDVAADIEIHGVDNVTVDLNGFTLTGYVKVYDCDGVNIKDGKVVSANKAFIIGWHQYTNVRWKDDNTGDYYSCKGYHPFAPAKNVVIEGVDITAPTIFSFTNINDDFTRDGQQQCYGKYNYKTGYTYPEQYVNGGYWSQEKLAEVFTFNTDMDSVILKDSDLSYTTALVENVEKRDGTNPEPGEGHSVEKVIKLNVLNLIDVTNAKVDAGRFLADGQLLVGESNSTFATTTTVPTEDYVAKVNEVYFMYAGGANDAINYSTYGETVYIRENATAEKSMGKDDTLDIVSDNDSTWTGAKAETGYGIVAKVDEVDDTITHYSTEIYVEASVWSGSTKLNDYGTLKEAFDKCGSDQTIKLERDVTITKSSNSYQVAYGVYFAGRRTFDLNGHTYTYTASGAAICTSQKTGVTNFIDSVGGGKIVATKGYCIYKCNNNTEYYTIKGGTYISESSAPICIAGLGAMVVYGGTFVGKTGTFVGRWGSPSVSNYLRFEGGTFSNDISTITNSKITIVSGKSSVDNGNGTWTVK